MINLVEKYLFLVIKIIIQVTCSHRHICTIHNISFIFSMPPIHKEDSQGNGTDRCRYSGCRNNRGVIYYPLRLPLLLHYSCFSSKRKSKSHTQVSVKNWHWDEAIESFSFRTINHSRMWYVVFFSTAWNPPISSASTLVAQFLLYHSTVKKE